MRRLLALALLPTACLVAETPLHTTILQLKNPHVAQGPLAARLTDLIMAKAKPAQTPSRAAVERFADDLVTALAGRDITSIRADALEKAIVDVMKGKGSTFMPATNLRQVLTACGVEEPTTRMIVDRFIEIGQMVRGPDDMKVLPVDRIK
jgi:hypothetical protein